MKRIFMVLVMLLLCPVWAACGDDADGKNADRENGDGLKLAPWGESRELSFKEKEDGSVWVVDENGSDVLNVTDYAKTEILGDEFTLETRVIKTYTPSGTAEVNIEGEYTAEINTYTYDYYDLNGKLLVEKSPYNLCSISGSWGLTQDEVNFSDLFFLETGKSVIGENYFEAYPTESGIVVRTYGYDNGTCVFYDQNGEEITSNGEITVWGYLSEFCRDGGYSGGWRALGPQSPACKASHGVAEVFPDESEWTDGGYDNNVYHQLIENVSPPINHKDDLLMFCRLPNDLNRFGLVRADGEILLDDEYLGFSYGGEDTVVAYAENQTEIYRLSDFSLIETLPYRMSLYDGENAVVQVDDYSFYLADAKGRQISEMNNGVDRIDMEEAGVRFLCRIAGSKDAAMLDRAGTQLYILTNEPGVTYVGDGQLAIHSGSGQYITDTNGVITQVVCLWDGYIYDETNNVIVPANEQ